MELNILMGAGLGALAGLALAVIYAWFPSGKIWPGYHLIREALVDPVSSGILVLAIAIGAIAAGWSADPTSAVAAALLGWQLLLLGVLDLSHRWLPDPLNLLLAATGLGFGAASGVLPDLLFGLIAGYASLELVRRGYRRLRGRDGLGGGDPKLFAAIGCWVSWQWLPWVMVLAAFGGLVAVAALALAGRRRLAAGRLPLGTMLALAAWPIWLVAR